MRILIGYSRCQYTRAAFEARGHDAWTCDLLPADGNHIQADIWDVASEAWDIAIFHPMCTYLTVSAAWAFCDPDYDKYPSVGYHQKIKPDTLVGAERREAREAELANFRRLLALPYPKAIENPARSFINKAIRPPDQVVHPYQFGDDASKATGLWLDRLKPLHINQNKRKHGRIVYNQHGKPAERWANQTDSGQNRLTPSRNRWLDRSATYKGIASAMAQAWG